MIEDGYHEVDFPNGGRFEGEIKGGMPNGRGMMLFPSGTCYKGEFKDAAFHGLGVKYFADGDRSGVERRKVNLAMINSKLEYNGPWGTRYISRMAYM